MSLSTISEKVEEVELRNHRALIADSALEYFIAILTGGAFLATLTKHFGIPDSLAGIIASVSAFTATFQLLSSSIPIKSSKTVSVVFGFARSLLLVAMYLLMIFLKDGTGKAVVYVCAILFSYIISDVSNPRKNKWIISLVDEKKRGRFTANNNIFSIASGIVFTYAMSAVNDYFKDAGRIETAFIINGFVILAIGILRVICLLGVDDSQMTENTNKSAFFKNVPKLIREKKFLKVTAVFTLWGIGAAVSTSFFGTYYIGELGLSLSFISIVSIFINIVNIFSIRAMGKLADRTSFERIASLGAGISMISFLVSAFMVPSNGVVMYILFTLFNAVNTSAVVCSKANLIYLSVPDELRVDALALGSCLSGIISFLSTLAMSPLIASIQKNGNTFLGISAYAQQVASAFSVVIMLLTFIIALRMNKKPED